MKYIDNIGQSLSDAANFVGNKTVNLFKQDATGDYSTRKAALTRQQKLADALTQMGAQEQAVYSAGGITAPVSPMAALARGLTSFGGGYLDRITAADEAALEKAEREAAREGMKLFYELPEKRGLVTSEVEGTKPYQATFQAPTLPGMPAPEAVTAELQMPVGPQTEAGMIPGGPRSRADQVRMANEFALGDNAILAKMAPALLAQTKPEFEGIGARGTMDTNPDSPTYGTVIGAPPEENEAPKVAGGLQWTGTEWKPIPGYTEQQAAIAAARRPDVIGGQPRMQQGNVFSLPDGKKVSAVFDPNRGQYGTVGNDGKFNPLPEGSRPTTASVGNPLSRSQYFKLKNDYRTEGTALTKMNKYFKTVGDANTGFAKLADQISAKVRTAFGSKTLTPEQLSSQVGEGQLQGLLGLFRTDIVGPGVMTEYDAERVLRALGGDFKLLQNPAVVKSLLQDIYADKMARVKDFETEINFNSQYFPGDVKPRIDVPETLGGGKPAAAGGPPPAAIADLKKNPTTRAQFDQVFGVGAAAKVLGK